MLYHNSNFVPTDKDSNAGFLWSVKIRKLILTDHKRF